MTTFKWAGILVLGSFLVAGCAKTTSTSSSSVDSETAGQTGFSAVDDVTDAITDDASASVTASELAMLQPDPRAASTDTDITVSRSCSAATDSSGSVTVTRTMSGSGTKTVTRPKFTMSMAMTASGTETRKWTPPTGQTLSCNASSSTVKFNWLSDAVVNGLKLDITVDKARDYTKTRTVTATNKSVSTVDKVTVKGTRSVTWATATASSTSNTARKKTITNSVTRSRTFTNTAGTTTTIDTTVATKTDAPLVVTVERKTSDGTLVTKTITSGTVVSTLSDGAKVETAFADLVYDFSSTNENVCLPTSGKVTGSVYAKDATTASKTFVITFGASTDSGVSISYDSGTAEDYPDYNSKGCDLQRES